jgi:hypothetical protein
MQLRQQDGVRADLGAKDASRTQGAIYQAAAPQISTGPNAAMTRAAFVAD